MTMESKDARPAPVNVLRIDASMRRDGSVTRAAATQAVAALEAQARSVRIDTLDLADTPVPSIDADWISANFTDAGARTDAQKAALALSDDLVDRLKAADLLVIGAPIYNFSVPAALKAWIDQVARAKLTFKYTENGPVGLLEGKKALVIVASGGVPVGSPVDYATPYLRHVLGFLGIHDVQVVAADTLMQTPEKAEAAIQETIEAALKGAEALSAA